MKKLIAYTLALLLVLSLCACGNDTPDTGDPNPSESKPAPTEAKPTDAEMAVLWEYRDLFDYLYYYAQYGSVDIYDKEKGEVIYNREALSYIYEHLQAIDTSVIDKWVGTEYTTSNYVKSWQSDNGEVDWDYSSYLSGFSVLEDVRLEEKITTLDHLDNQNSHTHKFDYRTDGTESLTCTCDNKFVFLKTNHEGLYGIPEYTYDGTGRAIQAKYKTSDGTVNFIVDFTYDERGNVTNKHIRDNNGEKDCTFEYDKYDRLVKVEYPDPWRANKVRTWIYTYDEYGNVVREEMNYHHFDYIQSTEVTDWKEIREYTYDANGSLVSGSYTFEVWYFQPIGWVHTNYCHEKTVDSYSITIDDQGRFLKIVVTHGDTVDAFGEDEGYVYDSPNHVTTTYDFVYGDYYFYTPAK